MGQPREASPSANAWSELLHAEVGYLLGQAGVPVLHIKGPTVALWLYPPGERSWGDVDILVAPSRMDDALSVLDQRGFHAFPGVTTTTNTDHAIWVTREGPEGGCDGVDVHDRFPGIDSDPERVFDILWARRQPAKVAHIDVWFPDLPSRAILTVLNAARTRYAEKARRDLNLLVDGPYPVNWEQVITLASAIEALPALRAGLELEDRGQQLVMTTELRDVRISVEWKLRLADAPRTALRLDELARLPWAQRGPTVARLLFPPPAILRTRDPRAVVGRLPLAVGYLRRLGDGLRSLPSSVRALRRNRRP